MDNFEENDIRLRIKGGDKKDKKGKKGKGKDSKKKDEKKSPKNKSKSEKKSGEKNKNDKKKKAKETQVKVWSKEVGDAVNGLRVLAADMVQAANSGHPGAPMGMAPIAYVLFSKFLKHNPNNPRWINRDRFVLSNGHSCALLYSVLHLAGYHFTLDDLKAFRKVGSKTPGHPEAGPHANSDGIEVTTGPLGQGLASAVGLAIAEKNLKATFNKPGFEIINNNTYVFCGDGCLQEGITSEAGSLAGHLGLGNIIVLYDDNLITIDGATDLSFSEDVGKRYEAYGWHVQTVSDGNNDLEAIEKAIQKAQKETGKPSLIKVRTTIGFGSSKEGTHGVHGSPLGDEDLSATKKKFGFDPEKKFNVPAACYEAFDAKKSGAELQKNWDALFASYEKSFPELAKDFQRRVDGKLPEGWEESLPTFTPDDKAEATRVSSGNVLNIIAKLLPEVIGGSADLNPSTKTYLKCSIDFQKDSPQGRNIRYGVREHAMCAITNGFALYGGFIPFAATFLNFIGYAWGAVTLSALSELRTIYVFTHDSIGVGEDGPTHQPVEKYAMCRSTPNLLFIRPADGNETVGAYINAIRHKQNPSVLSLTRQNVPQLKGSSPASVDFGGYVLDETEEGNSDIILAASGSEVSLCVEAQALLEKENLKVRVVSMPCWKLFEKQSEEYKAKVFPKGIPVLSVEAGTTLGWEKYAHYSLGINTFGASGPGKKVYEHFGITTENVKETATKLAKRFPKGSAPEKNIIL